MLKKNLPDSESKVIEEYKMLAPALIGEEGHRKDRTFSVTRSDLTFKDHECQVLSFKDITNRTHLKKEQQKVEKFTDLNASVHHEISKRLAINV